MKTKHPGMWGAPVREQRLVLGRRHADELAELRAERSEAPVPDENHTSVTVRFVARRRSWARSMRRSARYTAGVLPYVSAKTRRKWYFETPASAASVSRSSGSA